MNYRSPQLLSLAKLAPHCFRCFAPNEGQVVAAHSNQLRDGKGTGIKAHDFRIAWMCDRCHMEIDQGVGDKDWKREVWEECHRSTIAWLFRMGHLIVSAEPVELVQPPKKPSKKIRSAKAIPSRGFPEPTVKVVWSKGQKIASRPLSNRRASA